MRLIFLICIALMMNLTSCETFIHLQGHVFDGATGKPLRNTQILLVWKDKDTFRDIHFEYDTMDYNKRSALRKKGIKDDYKLYSVGGLSKKPTPVMTDTSGFFELGTILFPYISKRNRMKFIFLKDGYRKQALPLSAIVSDSVAVSLAEIPMN